MKHTVFLLAHYDDEFGIFHEIKNCIALKIPIHVVYATSSSSDGRKNLIREIESLKVLNRLGVIESQVSFLGRDLKIPDLKLKNHFILLFQNLNVLLSELGEIGNIYTLAYEGGHPDHDGLNFICSRLSNNHNLEGNIWQFPLYNGAGLIGSFFHLLKPLKKNGPVIEVKLALKDALMFLSLIFIYKSQTKTFVGLFPFYFLHMTLIRSQTIQKIILNRVEEKPHEGTLLYERRKMDTYENVRSKMNEFDAWYYKQA